MDHPIPCLGPCRHPECSARRLAALEHAVTEVEPAVKVAATQQKTVSKTVSKTAALTNAEHQARWRKAHPGEHAAQQRAARARRKEKV